MKARLPVKLEISRDRVQKLAIEIVLALDVGFVSDPDGLRPFVSLQMRKQPFRQYFFAVNTVHHKDALILQKHPV